MSDIPFDLRYSTPVSPSGYPCIATVSRPRITVIGRNRKVGVLTRWDLRHVGRGRYRSREAIELTLEYSLEFGVSGSFRQGLTV